MGRKRAANTETEDAERTALAARCDLMGWPKTEYWLRRARSPRLETEAGRIVERAKLSEQERVELGEVIEHMRRVQTRYRRAIDAPNPNPANAAIKVMSEWAEEEVEMPQSSGPVSGPIDELEEYRRAVAAHNNLSGWMRKLDVTQHADLVRAVYADAPPRYTEAVLSGLRALGKRLRGERTQRPRRDLESFTKGEPV